MVVPFRSFNMGNVLAVGEPFTYAYSCSYMFIPGEPGPIGLKICSILKEVAAFVLLEMACKPNMCNDVYRPLVKFSYYDPSDIKAIEARLVFCNVGLKIIGHFAIGPLSTRYAKGPVSLSYIA